MSVIPVRELLHIHPRDIPDTLPPRVTVLFEDGITLSVKRRSIAYSWFIWEFHRRYPFLPLTHRHHVDSVLKGGLLSMGTHIELLDRVTRELVLSHGLDSYEQIESIQDTIYDVVNMMMNELPKLTGAYVATLCIEDILEVEDDPDIATLRRETKPTASSIADFYSKAHKVIAEKPELKDNALMQFIQMRILNNNQVNQCILARGFPIEVTGTILTTPIMANYTSGMLSLYDFASESRAASKHLYSADAPLQDTEYFARRLQLVGMVLRNVVKRDCGSTRYLEWLIRPPTYSGSGRQLYAGDRKYLRGKKYWCEQEHVLKEIRGDETQLDGRIVKLRSVLYCQEQNPHQVCSHCFGGLHHNVSRFANLGHLCDANLTQLLTQTILSTKHVISSATGAAMYLKEDARRYLQFNPVNMTIKIKAPVAGSKIQLIVSREEAIGLTDIRLLPYSPNINAERISSISGFEIVEEQSNGARITTPIQIEQNKRQGHFTQEFLQYLKERGWLTNENDYFVLDLDRWDFRFPIIGIPDMEYSYSDHADQIASLIESNSEKAKKNVNRITPANVIQELFDLVNSKIEVNLALLEIIVYSNMTPTLSDYGLARHASNPTLNVSRFITSNRSLGPAYAYEHQAAVIQDPRSFFKQNRPDSPIDVFICPQEVVQHRRLTP